MNNLICCVAIAKYEEEFIDEWLVYHKNILGINHFFIYDDDPNLPLQDFLKYHIDNKYVDIINWSLIKNNFNYNSLNQLNAYNHAFHNLIKKYKWVIFIDIDEFLVLKNHNNIIDFLNEYDIYDSIFFNWHVFGHNGYYENPKDLITSSLIKRKKEPRNIYKSITKINSISNIISPHYCLLHPPFKKIDPNKNRYNGKLYDGITQNANINHYQYRSFLNWMNRANRGDVNFNDKNVNDDINKEHKWRLTENSLLKQFVITSADKNEIVDDYMLKYKDLIKNHLNIKNNGS